MAVTQHSTKNREAKKWSKSLRLDSLVRVTGKVKISYNKKVERDKIVLQSPQPRCDMLLIFDDGGYILSFKGGI